MNSKGRKIHALGAKAREKGNLLEALKLADEALIAYQINEDVIGIAEIQAEKALIYRHLYQKTGDKNFLIIAKNIATAGVEIAMSSGNNQALAIPLFNLAKTQEELKEYQQACINYQKALDNLITNPLKERSVEEKSAIIDDVKIHLGVCQYKTGNKEGLNQTLAALDDLESKKINQYDKDVWLSGGYIKIAEILKSKDQNKSKEYLAKARAIITSNPALILRRNQLGKKLAKG